MSATDEMHSGDWLQESDMLKIPSHKEFIESISGLKPLEKDEAYKKAAIQNIKSKPVKFVKNCIANLGRLVFSYPYSYTEQSISSFFTIVPNMFFVVLLSLTLPFCVVRYRQFPEGFMLLFVFVLIYLGGSTLVSAYRRMFYITMPFWAVYFSFVYSHIFKISISKR
jgi:hypothetical protein